jgi:hypothetical protein
MYQGAPAAETVTPDRFGEIKAGFRDMRPGLGYGIRWAEAGRIHPDHDQAQAAPRVEFSHGTGHGEPLPGP